MFQHEDYKIGWICALPKERTAAVAMLDERHEGLSRLEADHNAYTLGSIGEHNIVIACLPKGKYGTIPAATAATNMMRTFPAIRFALMVGIGGGAHPDVRLGDVVVSVPQDDHPGVVQWDMGKTEHGGTFRRTGALNNPPTLLLTALSLLESDEELGYSKIPRYLEEFGMKFPHLKGKYLKSDALKDVLFDKEYSHQGGTSNCENCAEDRMIKRGPEKFTVHCGTIASGNQVIKDAIFRDSLVRDLGGNVFCIEMEAAGLMNNFPCLVIRGICDYADSHKNKAWQEHAAAVAAACAKELLRHVMVDNVAAEKAAKEVLSQINQSVTTINKVTTETQQLLKEKEDTDVLNWLSMSHYGSEQSEALERWHPETCQWFLGSQEYQDWLQERGKTLYCPGIPGAGKTTMSAAVIRDISSHLSVHTNFGLAYVYFVFSRQREQSVEHVLASLLMQFLCRQASVPDFVRDIYEHHKKSGTRATREELMNMLSPVILQYERAYIVLDALDECTTENQCRKEILSDMLALQVSAGTNILATSRENEEIVSMFNHRDTATSIIPIRAHNGDVSIFLHRQLEKKDADIFDAPIRDLVVSRVTRVSDGMFLLARLHINTLINMTTKKKVKIALEGLATGPEGLDTVYEQTMNRIQDQGKDRNNMAKLILLWIVHARRPLSIKELQHALSVEPGCTEMDRDNIPSVRIINSVCAGLVQVVDRSNKADKWYNEGVDRSQISGLIHYTAQEYLEKTQAKWFPDAQRFITQTCVAYLSFPGLCGYCDDDEKFKERLEAYPFYDYAVCEWSHHARMTSAEPKVVDFLRRRDEVEGSTQALLQPFHPRRFSYHARWSPNDMNGLHLAAFFGLRNAASELLKIFDANDQDLWERIPLHWAAEQGHSDVVKLLIEAGKVNVNRLDDRGSSALVLAAREGHPDVVKLLIETRKVDVNRFDDAPYTALFLACEGGHWNVVEMLINTQQFGFEEVNQGRDASLFLEIEKEFSAMAQLLIEREKVSLDWTGTRRVPTLLLAVENGFTNVAVLLIESGRVGVDRTNARGASPLHSAAQRGQTDIVLLLIETEKVAFDRFDSCGKSALFYAVENGHLDIICLLVEAGDGAIDRDDPDRTLLSLAADKGNSHTVEFLVNNGLATLDVKDINGQTALMKAATFGHWDVAQLLIGAGITVLDASDKDGQTALMKAAEQGHSAIAGLIIKTGEVNVDGEDNNFQTALMYAAKHGHLDMARLLVNFGKAEVDRKDESGQTALIHAVDHGNWTVVRLLLDSGADPNIADDRIHSAMEHSRIYDHRLIEDILVPVDLLWGTRR